MNDTKLELWISERPKRVQAVIRRFPPTTCYRSRDGRGHYSIYAYDEEKSGKITLRVNHMPDSFLPAVRVFGVKQKDMRKCGCIYKANA